MKSILFTAILSALLLPSSGFGYFSLLDTGDLLEPGKYNLTAETQFVTSGADGLNLRFHFDQRAGEATQFRFLLGTGVNALQTGLSFKWIPYPDFEKQPAMGLITGITYTRLNGSSLVALHLRALASKRFENDYGDIIPYGGILAGIQVAKNEDSNPSQFFVGSKFKSLNWEELYLYTELGAEIVDSFSYFSLGLQWQFDDSVLPATTN